MTYNYEAWIKQVRRRLIFIKTLIYVFVFVIGISIGMFFQSYLDKESREMAQECMKRDLSSLEYIPGPMPEPTEDQKQSARNNAKRVTPEYLDERLGNKQ